MVYQHYISQYIPMESHVASYQNDGSPGRRHTIVNDGGCLAAGISYRFISTSVLKILTWLAGDVGKQTYSLTNE